MCSKSHNPNDKQAPEDNKQKKPDKKSAKASEKARVHKDLEGLDLRVNALGEVESTIDISRINRFLDKNVKDKKIEEKQTKEKPTTRKKQKGQKKGTDPDEGSE